MHWTQPETFPELRKNEAHIWLLDLSSFLDDIERWELNLSAVEKKRADRLCETRRSKQFIIARGLVKELLGSYLRIAPSELELRYTPAGKPFTDHPIQFNIAHSHELSLFVISPNIPLGVDIEFRKELRDFKAIARRFFSKDECELLSLATHQESLRIFYDIWVRKEAFIKLYGGRLFEMLPNLKNPDFLTQVALINTQNILINNSYAAALAANTKLDILHYFKFKN